MREFKLSKQPLHTGYCFIIRHKEHPVFNQFYYGGKGIIMGTERWKQVRNLEKQYAKVPVSDMVGAKVEFFPLDGRTKKAKRLPWFNVDCLID